MTDSSAAPGEGRAPSLDLLKTLLVAGMISAHVIQLIAEEPSQAAWVWSDYVNLVTFSGFLLAFGLGAGLGSGRPKPIGRRMRPALAMLLAVWVSSFGFLLLVERAPLDRFVIREVLTTEALFGWSEFLTSFLVLYLLLAFARPLLVAVAARPRWLLATCVAALAMTIVTTGLWWPLIGGVLSHRSYPNFPVLPYLPWFLLGLHLGLRRRRIEGGDLALGAAATGAFLYSWAGGRMPERFPPSVLWIVGPGLPLALYLWASERLGSLGAAAPPGGGAHVLASLVLSNLAIFGIRYLWGFPVQGDWAILGASLGLFAGVTLWGVLLDRLGGRVAP
jgi:hypothetical protein